MYLHIKVQTKPTFWQTTHRGKPSGSTHSPGPSGSDTSPSLAAVACVPSKFREPPRPLSFHWLMTSSMVILFSSGKASKTVRNRSIHSLSCRTQDHGSDQSKRTTRSVFGIDCGVRSGFIRGAKEGEGLVRRYAEMRASMSAGKKSAVRFYVPYRESLNSNLPSWSASRRS